MECTYLVCFGVGTSCPVVWLQCFVLATIDGTQGMHRAYGNNPHNVHGPIKAENHLSYHLAAKKCIFFFGKLQTWLHDRAVWKGGKNTLCSPGDRATCICTNVESDFEALQVMKEACCEQADCVSASSR